MENKYNILRAITFYNNFIPPATAEIDWQFCCFGVVDGINISSQILCGTDENIVMKIWDQRKVFCNSLIGKWNAQQIYGIRHDDPDKENVFWENDNTAFPFFFFCRIQCDDNKISLWKKRDAFEQEIQSDAKVRAITYLTYDNSDLIMILKTSDYKTGAGIINELHQRKKLSFDSDSPHYLKNSFTTFAVRYDYISKIDDTKRQQLNTDLVMIKNAYVSLISKSRKDISNIQMAIEKRIHKEIKRVPILGTQDEMLVIDDIGWGDFLRLYDKENGVFNNSVTQPYILNASGVTTNIAVELDPVAPNEIIDEDVYTSKIYTKTESIREFLNSEIDDNMMEIKHILNVLPKFNGVAFNDYIIFPVLKPLETLLELMNTQKYNKEPFYEFLRSFCMYVQSSSLSDRHAAQIMGFNTKIYDIPIRLNAFYNAYLYMIKTLLNTEENKTFDFIAFPGMNNFVKVSGLYEEAIKDKHLIKAEIPEASFYHMHDMMMILAHETAHYVGTELRKRDTRKPAIIHSYAHVYVCYMRSGLKAGIVSDLSVWEDVLARVDATLLSALESKTETNSEPHLRQLFDKDDHMSQLQILIHRMMCEIAQFSLDGIFAPVLGRMEQSDSEDARKYFHEMSARFLSDQPARASDTSSKTVLELLGSIYRESFADLMAILLLEADPKDYFDSLIRNAIEQDMNLDDFCKSEVMLRTTCITMCMLNDNKNKEIWVQQLENYNDEKWVQIGRAAFLLWEHLRKKDIVPDASYADNVHFALRDKNILISCIHYLSECKEAFEKLESLKRDEIGELRRMFQCFSPKKEISAEEQLIKLEEAINIYKKMLSGELQNDKRGSIDERRNKDIS